MLNFEYFLQKGVIMGFFQAFGIGSSQNKNAQKGKDANKRDYDKGNTRDNSKTHLKSGGGRAGGNNKPGGRR